MRDTRIPLWIHLVVSSEGQEATPTLPRLLPPVGARAFIKLLRCTARARRPGVAATPRLDRGSSVVMVTLGRCSIARAHDLLMTSFWPLSSFGSARGSTHGIAPDVDCASTHGRGLYAYGRNTRARCSDTPPARVVTGTWRHVFVHGVLRSEMPSTSCSSNSGMTFAVPLSRYVVGARYIRKLGCGMRDSRCASGICVLSGGFCESRFGDKNSIHFFHAKIYTTPPWRRASGTPSER